MRIRSEAIPMRGSESGFAHGTSGSPQSTFESWMYALKVLKNERAVENSMINENLVAELERKGVKFSRENMLFITRDKTGQIIWLENGSKGAGLEHIQMRHARDFADKVNVRESDIPAFLHRVITYGTVVENKIVKRHGRDGYSRKYRYAGRDYILTGIGLNGFLVSAYPID